MAGGYSARSSDVQGDVKLGRGQFVKRFGIVGCIFSSESRRLCSSLQSWFVFFSSFSTQFTKRREFNCGWCVFFLIFKVDLSDLDLSQAFAAVV